MRHSVNALGGYELDLPPGDLLARKVARGVPYEHELLRVAAAVVGTGVVVDAGAHAGNHSVYLAKAGASVVAFEPNPAIRAYLHRNIAANGLADRITVHPVGLWGRSTTARVVEGEAGNTGHAQVAEDPDGDVDLIALDSLDLAPDLIKIDVEGAEMEVLRGAVHTLEAHRPAVLVEAHEGLAEVTELLARFGYRRLSGSWAASPTYLFVTRRSHYLRAAPFIARRVLRPAYRLVRGAARRIPGMPTRRGLRRLASELEETRQVLRLRWSRARVAASGGNPEVVVSLTTFPARIRWAWIPIETMLRQDHPPDRIVLVLSEEEFPDKDLPRRLRRQQRRGLEILWSPTNYRSYNKLIPTRAAYPDAVLVTVDDDAFYEPWTVSSLVAHAREHPRTIVGHRGWEVQPSGDGLAPYSSWPEAGPATPAERVFLTAVGGMLFPPDALPSGLLADMDLAMKLSPSADDIWYWAVANAAGVPAHCLGFPSYLPLRRLDETPKLETKNLMGGQNDVQLAAVIAHFGLILDARAKAVP